VVKAVATCVAAGAPGITVHPRADARHITFADVRDIARELAPPDGGRRQVELNIEGDPRPDLIALAHEVRSDQFTMVPVRPGEITSQAGWDPATPLEQLREVVRSLQSDGIRVSIFVDAAPEAARWAAKIGADRIELYTEPFARAFEAGPDAARASFDRYAAMATLAHDQGLGVNAGHDLDLHNLVLFRELPHLEEVSIGHALIADALDDGLAQTVRNYLAAIGRAA
jgi:pyridoxine 5-phosphate synthase